MFYADRLSDYISAVSYDEIPDEVVEKIKHCIIDSIACMIVGAQLETGSILVRTIAGIEGGEYFLWGRKERCSLLMAAFLNSAFANAMDFDDVSFTDGPLSGMHPGCTTIPPALTLAEYQPTSGKRFVEAIIAGYEVQERVGEAVLPTEDQLKKIKGQGTFQTFGAAAAAAKLLGLGKEETSQALGITGGNAPVASVRKTLTNSEVGVTMVKNNYGMASFNGVLSALLARNGFTGPTNIFEGATGFWRMIGSDQSSPERLIKDLGTEYRTLNTSFKPYPCCRYFHSSLDAVLKLAREHKLDAAQIDSVMIEVIPYVAENYSRRSPRNFVDAVFSLPLSVALEVLRLPYGLERHFAENIKNPEVLRFMEKVEVRSLPVTAIGASRKNYYPTEVTISGGSGSYKTRVEYPLGSPQNPLTLGQLEKKFFYLTEDVLGRKKSSELLEKLEAIETIGNIKKEIIALL